MENSKKFVFNEQTAINVSGNLISQMKQDETVMKAANLDDAYEVFKKYAQITKEEFKKIYDFGVQIRKRMESDDGSFELSEFELDGVVGGSIFGDAWKKVKSAASSVSKFAKETWNDMPDWAQDIVIGVGIGAAAGLVVLTCGAGVLAAQGVVMTAKGAAILGAAWAGAGATAGGMVGGLVGGIKGLTK